MSLPPTSVIIASRNRPAMLHDTVTSILGQDELPHEIIIMDQSREPHVLLTEMRSFRGCEIWYCWSQSIGTSKARNLALQRVRYEHIVIIDDDMFVASDWLKNLIGGLVRGGIKCVVSGKVLPAGTSDTRFTPSTRTDEEPALYEDRVGKDVLWSNNMAMHRSVMEDIGFFDERLGPGTDFPAGEDNDYGFRLLEAGYRILYLPSAVVYHRDWRSKKDYLRLRWMYGVGRGAYYAKYFNLSDQYQLRRMIEDVGRHMLLVFSREHRDWLKLYGDLVLAGGIVIGACRWLSRYGLARR